MNYSMARQLTLDNCEFKTQNTILRSPSMVATFVSIGCAFMQIRSGGIYIPDIKLNIGLM